MVIKCTRGEHGDCNACREYVEPTRIHAHVFNAGRSRNDVICNKCWSLVAASSTVILQALEAFGIRTTGIELARMASRQEIAVLIQANFDVIRDASPGDN